MNYPIDKQNIDDIDTEVNQFTLAEECGLSHEGFDEDGLPTFIGSRTSWAKFAKLLTQNNL